MVTDISQLATKVRFDPRESCTFMPNHEKQMVELIVKNDSSLALITKLKSTRPKHYKMKPVFAVVKPGEKKTIKLVFKGFPKGSDSKPSKRDHFSIVYSVPPDGANITDPRNIWRTEATKQALAVQGVYKKAIKIKYTGFNDKEPDVPTMPELVLDKTQLAKILRNDQPKPDPNPTAPITVPVMSATTPPPGKPLLGDQMPIIYLVYKKHEEEEEEEEEEDEDDEEEEKPKKGKK